MKIPDAQYAYLKQDVGGTRTRSPSISINQGQLILHGEINRITTNK